MPTVPTDSELSQRLIDDLAPALVSQFGIDPRVAACVADWLRSVPDLLEHINEGRSYIVVAPESFAPQLLDRVRARLAMHAVIARIHAAGHDPGAVALVELSAPLRLLRQAQAAIRTEMN